MSRFEWDHSIRTKKSAAILVATYRGFGKKRCVPTAVVEDLSEVPAMDENALDVFVGTANENSNELIRESRLITQLR